VRGARAAAVALALGAALVGARGFARAHGAPAARDACASAGRAEGPGALDPFRPPTARAAELNAAGKAPYRQGKWDEARAQYRAAEAADPEFLAPKLNVACSFVRQERFTEATAEVVSLLERAYVPWAREIAEAADLGALKVRPEMNEIRRALVASAARWADGLPSSALFVARQRAPLRVPDGPGVFILNPHQEVWAFTPATGRYRQVTAEDGHVVALARGFGGHIAYVTAAKLVRGAAATDVALRGVAVHELDLTTLTPGPSADVEGDVLELEIAARAPARNAAATQEFVYTIVGDRTNGPRVLSAAGAFVPALGRAPSAPLVTLTARGARAAAPARGGKTPEATCSDDLVEAAGPNGVLRLSLHQGRGPALPLKPAEGAGRAGLPIP
jgi:hypothetical protein